MVFSSCKEKEQPIVKNDLRAPAYPLITIDPYTSGWSFGDYLYESPVKHWTGKDFPLTGVIKVDGETFRFMGMEEIEFQPIVPSSEQGKWEGKYTTDKPRDNWFEISYDDNSWATRYIIL